jgi:alkylation response protein AidB-like acyl-CoA dehydrogenase
MIIGIGSDLIDITRVAKVIERHGERFLDRIFTTAERAKAERRSKNEKMVVATYAKRFAADMAMKATTDAVQIFGGYGYMLEYPAARAYVDARIQRIYGGTNEIMKEVIARSLVGR